MAYLPPYRFFGILFFGTRSKEYDEVKAVMERVRKDFCRALQTALMSREEFLAFCDNTAIQYMTPDELLEFAQAEAAIKEAEDSRLALFERVRARASFQSAWQDKVSPQEEKIIEGLSAEEREFMIWAYPEEMDENLALARRIEEAQKKRHEIIGQVVKRMPETAD